MPSSITWAPAVLRAGEFVNQEHTPARTEHLIFGGYEVGIGFSGQCDAAPAKLEAIALAGKRSIRFAAMLTLMRPFIESQAMKNAPATRQILR